MARIVVTRTSEAELKALGAFDWPIWTCDVSRFDWHYDQKESCYLLAGQVTVTTAEETVRFGKGDFVVFPSGLDCTWDVSVPVRKHYKFG